MSLTCGDHNNKWQIVPGTCDRVTCSLDSFVQLKFNSIGTMEKFNKTIEYDMRNISVLNGEIRTSYVDGISLKKDDLPDAIDYNTTLYIGCPVGYATKRKMVATCTAQDTWLVESDECEPLLCSGDSMKQLLYTSFANQITVEEVDPDVHLTLTDEKKVDIPDAIEYGEKYYLDCPSGFNTNRRMEVVCGESDVLEIATTEICSNKLCTIEDLLDDNAVSMVKRLYGTHGTAYPNQPNPGRSVAMFVSTDATGETNGRILNFDDVVPYGEYIKISECADGYEFADPRNKPRVFTCTPNSDWAIVKDGINVTLAVTSDLTAMNDPSNSDFRRVCNYQTACYEFAPGKAYSATVPPSIDNIDIQLWGASGGITTTATTRNQGGYVSGALNTVVSKDIYVVVGTSGSDVAPIVNPSSATSGGYNGGGYGSGTNANEYAGAGGGGATDIRLGGILYSDRKAVAGGGGGNSGANIDISNRANGGSAGGLTGLNGTSQGKGRDGKGGSQISSIENTNFETTLLFANVKAPIRGAGGSAIAIESGDYQNGGNTLTYFSSGGGGAGWYGGGAGIFNSGGGGSSYNEILTNNTFGLAKQNITSTVNTGQVMNSSEFDAKDGFARLCFGNFTIKYGSTSESAVNPCYSGVASKTTNNVSGNKCFPITQQTVSLVGPANATRHGQLEENTNNLEVCDIDSLKSALVRERVANVVDAKYMTSKYYLGETLKGQCRYGSAHSNGNLTSHLKLECSTDNTWIRSVSSENCFSCNAESLSTNDINGDNWYLNTGSSNRNTSQRIVPNAGFAQINCNEGYYANHSDSRKLQTFAKCIDGIFNEPKDDNFANVCQRIYCSGLTSDDSPLSVTNFVNSKGSSEKAYTNVIVTNSVGTGNSVALDCNVADHFTSPNGAPILNCIRRGNEVGHEHEGRWEFDDVNKQCHKQCSGSDLPKTDTKIVYKLDSATISDTSWINHDVTLTASCASGYELVGTTYPKCSDGKWKNNTNSTTTWNVRCVKTCNNSEIPIKRGVDWPTTGTTLSDVSLSPGKEKTLTKTCANTCGNSGTPIVATCKSDGQWDVSGSCLSSVSAMYTTVCSTSTFIPKNYCLAKGDIISLTAYGSQGNTNGLTGASQKDGKNGDSIEAKYVITDQNEKLYIYVGGNNTRACVNGSSGGAGGSSHIATITGDTTTVNNNTSLSKDKKFLLIAQGGKNYDGVGTIGFTNYSSSTLVTGTKTTQMSRIGTGMVVIGYDFRYTQDYAYTGKVATFSPSKYNLKAGDIIKLETWGASGSFCVDGNAAGLGGYSYGYYKLPSNADLYVVVGGTGTLSSGGYNGGGGGDGGGDTAGGGGATHIATTNLGALRYYSSTANQAKVLMVAGGGGGGSQNGACWTNMKDVRDTYKDTTLYNKFVAKYGPNTDFSKIRGYHCVDNTGCTACNEPGGDGCGGNLFGNNGGGSTYNNKAISCGGGRTSTSNSTDPKGRSCYIMSGMNFGYNSSYAGGGGWQSGSTYDVYSYGGGGGGSGHLDSSLLNAGGECGVIYGHGKAKISWADCNAGECIFPYCNENRIFTDISNLVSYYNVLSENRSDVSRGENSIINLTCKSGYVGKPSVVCDDSGKWKTDMQDGTDNWCYQNGCLLSSAPVVVNSGDWKADGLSDTRQIIPNNSTLTIACNMGFFANHPNGDTRTTETFAKCSNGKITIPSTNATACYGVCNVTQTEVVKNSEYKTNAYFIADSRESVLSGQQIGLACNETNGYFGSDIKMQCNGENVTSVNGVVTQGTWSFVGTNRCKKQCTLDSLSSFLNSNAYSMSGLVAKLEGEEQSLKCASDYSGSATVKCNVDGSWSFTNTNRCLRICPVIDFMDDNVGYNVFSQVVQDEVVHPTCQSGYKSDGVIDLKCNSNAKYTFNSSNRCNKVCYANTFDELGHNSLVIDSSGVYVGNSATVTCATGYGSSNPISVKCLENGDWDFVNNNKCLKQCNKTALDALLKDGYIIPSFTTKLSGEEVNVTCDLNNYQKSNSNANVVAKCGADGSWSVTNECVRFCKKGDFKEEGYKAISDLKYGSNPIQLICDDGYSSGSISPALKCNADGTWSFASNTRCEKEPEPEPAPTTPPENPAPEEPKKDE
jgi:hypothetical protein